MRFVDRVLSCVIAVGVLALGVLVPIEVIRTRLLEKPGHLLLPFESVSRALRDTEWRSRGVIAIAAGVAVLGLILLVAECVPRRLRLLTMVGGDRDTRCVISRRGVARTLMKSARAVPRISRVRARVTGRRASVRARVSWVEPGEVTAEVTERLTESLADLELLRPPKLRLRLTQDERRPRGAARERSA